MFMEVDIIVLVILNLLFGLFINRLGDNVIKNFDF